MTEQQARDEIVAVVAYYTERGWDWLSVVGYLSASALDILPQDVVRRCKRKESR